MVTEGRRGTECHSESLSGSRERAKRFVQLGRDEHREDNNPSMTPVARWSAYRPPPGRFPRGAAESDFDLHERDARSDEHETACTVRSLEICLVLGAGATLANALHFHGERIGARNPPLDYTFFPKIEALGMVIPSELRAYSARAPGPNPFDLRAGQPSTRMEEFFKDLFLDFQEAASGSATILAYEQLVDIYVKVLRRTTNWIGEDQRTGGPVGRLLAAAAEGADKLTVVTFNHDLVIENELMKRARLRRRWCIDQGYGSIPLHFSRTGLASFPGHSAACNHASPIVLLKLHGSLNWYVRMQSRHPSRTVLSGSGPPPTILCTRRRAVETQLQLARATAGRGRSTWYTWPVVVPPVHGKETLIRKFVPGV